MEAIIALEKEIESLRKTLNDKEYKLDLMKREYSNRLNIDKAQESAKNKTRISGKLSKPEIERYSRQILLPEIGVSGQERICAAKVLVVGAGGLGCPAAVYLAGAGVGEIGIIDYDTVDVTNIHRQFLHDEANQGISKAESAANKLRSINSSIKVTPYTTQLDSSTAVGIASHYDVILDCSDNVPTRYLLNDLCVLLKKPLISGSALKLEGQLTIYGYRGKLAPGPCYRCVFPRPPPPDAVGSCSANGVAGPVPGVIGCLQALEAIKYVIGMDPEQLLVKRMLIFDGQDMSFRIVKLRGQNPTCAVCSHNATITRLIDYELFCKSKAQERDLSLQLLPPTHRITPLQLHSQLLDCEQRHLLVDVRTNEEFQMCRIDGSSNVPIEKCGENMGGLVKEYDIVTFICRRGNDSQIAAQKLIEHLQNDSIVIRDVIGGLHAWAKYVDNEFPVY